MFHHFALLYLNKSTSSPGLLGQLFSFLAIMLVVVLTSIFTYCKLLPNLVNSHWSWWIIHGILADQKQRNILIWIMIKMMMMMMIFIIIIIIIITTIKVDIFTYLYKFHLFKGWEQGVIGMKKGGKRLIAIPSSLAYGEKVCGQHSACKESSVR